MIADNLLERGWELYQAAQRLIGMAVDEASFVGGFTSCFGIMTFKVNVGHRREQVMQVLFERVERDIADVLGKITAGAGEVNPDNLIQRTWQVFAVSASTKDMTIDEPSFVGGFATCFGICMGRLDVGLPEDTTLLAVFERLQRDLDDNARKVLVAGRDVMRRPH